MCRSLFIAAATVLLVTATVPAEDAAQPFWKSTAAQDAAKKTVRLDHLRRAIEHLQSAGLSDLAIQIEEHAEREVLRSELSLKRTELQNISQDIRRLERLLSSETETANQPKRQPQITTRIKMVEVDVARLDELGFKLGRDGLSGIFFEASDSADAGSESFRRQKLVDASAAKLLDWLCDSQFAKVLAEPVLITTSGKPASFFSGGKVPIVTTAGEEYSIHYRQVGTRIELVALLLPNGKIRLDVRPTLSRVVQAAATDESKSASSEYESRTFDAVAELESGQTLALGGITTASKRAEGVPAGDSPEKLFKRLPNQRELIVLITPEIVNVTTDPAEGSSESSENDSAPRVLQLFPKALEAAKQKDGP